MQSLLANPALVELYLLGNPCTDWAAYRDYVIGVLPNLQRLDGMDIKPSDRILALQVWLMACNLVLGHAELPRTVIISVCNVTGRLNPVNELIPGH